MKKCMLVLVAAIVAPWLRAQSTHFDEVNAELLDLFKDYSIVAIGEGMHNSELTAVWLHSFIHQKNFSETVQNIVVEFGTSEHQDIMDDFISGKDVPDSLLRMCWRNTTQLFVWDNPVYEAFFRDVRELNKSRPEEKKVRVLLADLPFTEFEKSRDENAFKVVQREVLKQNENALLLFGDMHFLRRDVFLNYALPENTAPDLLNVVQLLEMEVPGEVFSIWGSVNTRDAQVQAILSRENISSPQFVKLDQSALGKMDFTIYYPWADYRTDGMGVPVDSAQFISLTIDKVVDGILFRGNWEEQMEKFAPRPDEIYSDTAYVSELIRRSKITDEKSRQSLFEFFKLRWSSDYEPLLQTLRTAHPAEIDDHFSQLKLKYPDFMWFQVLYRLGYRLLESGDLSTSAAAFELITREFPESASGFVGLGDARLKSRNTEMAIESYTRALMIDPSNSWIQEKLDDARK